MSITILPHRLRLLSIPRASLHQFTQSLTRNIVFPPDDQPIFSITETAVEISIVADAETVERDFVPFREGTNIEIIDDLFRALVLSDEEGLGMFTELGRRRLHLGLYEYNSISVLAVRNSTRHIYLLIIYSNRIF